MFQLIDEDHKKVLNKILTDNKEPEDNLALLLNHIRADIPEKKRVSYGRYSILKKMGPLIKDQIAAKRLFSLGQDLFLSTKANEFIRSLGIQLLTIYAVETDQPDKVLPIIKRAAGDSSWEVRECSAGFVRKLVWKYPDKMHKWYMELVKSENPLLRRFVSESLRPVADNKWLKKNMDYVISLIENLYEESDKYPRSSVGNNLSDWSKFEKEKVFDIVKKLVESGNKNSYWIATRACRNLVKKEPVRVMNMLKTDVYKYKTKEYYRKNYQ